MQAAFGATWPVFYFQVQEIRPARHVTPRYTLGVLGPPIAHRLASRGINTRLFYCNGNTILPQREGTRLTPDYELHSTFSMYKIGAYVYALNGDVLQQTGSLGVSEYHDPADMVPQDHWQHITFAHRPGRRSSYVGFGFNQGQLAARRQNAAWVQSLIPRAYQSEMLATDAEAGGLDGDLAIILGLMRFREEPALSQFTSYCVMQNGTWWMLPPPTPSPTRPQTERGIVVRVWTCPGMSTLQDLQTFENYGGTGDRIFD